MNLSAETIDRIESTIPKYPEKRSAVMMLLHYIQDEKGYLSNEAIEWVAEKLDMQPINVLSVVTFFPYYRQEDQKIGKVHVRVCRTLSCAMRGAYKVGDELSKKFGCKIGHSTDDGNVTLEYAECLAACGTGPVVLVDEDLYENIESSKLDGLIGEIEKRVAAPEKASA